MLTAPLETRMSHPTRWLLLLAIVIGAAGLRLWRIDTLPPGLYFDEAYEGLEAWRIYSDPTYRPIFLKGDFGVVPLNAYANALMFGVFRFFGWKVGPVAMHVTAACFGILGVIALYGLAPELQKMDRRKPGLSLLFPLFAAAVLAVMRWHIHFSRMGIEEIIVPLTWAGALWLLLRGWRTGHWFAFVGCGIFVAASMYAYEAAWIIPFLMVLAVGQLVVQDRGVVALHRSRPASEQQPSSVTSVSLQRRLGVLLAALTACLLFAPLGWFFWHHPEQVLLRFRQVTVVDSLAQNAAPDSAWANVWATVKMYGLFDELGDRTSRRNLGSEPALNLWLTLAFYVGVALTVWRLRRFSYALVLIGLVGLLLPGAPTEHAPQFGRLIGATAPTALICAIGLDGLWQWRPSRAVVVHWVSVLLIVLGGVTSTYDYFWRWATLPSLYNAFDVGVWQLTQQIKQLPSDVPVYLAVQNPYVHAVTFAMQTNQHAVPVTFDGRHIFPLPAQPSAQPALYIVLTDNRYTEKLLPQIFPQATVQQEVLDPQGKVYARFYALPANAAPQYPPQVPLPVTLGDGIGLLGYSVYPTPLKAGTNLYVQFHWLVTAIPTRDWTVSARVITKNAAAKDAAGKPKVVAEQSIRPGKNSLPTNRWQPGWRLVDEYKIKLPSELAPGLYDLALQLSTPQGAHLPVDGIEVFLGTITVEASANSSNQDEKPAEP